MQNDTQQTKIGQRTDRQADAQKWKGATSTTPSMTLKGLDKTCMDVSFSADLSFSADV